MSSPGRIVVRVLLAALGVAAVVLVARQQLRRKDGASGGARKPTLRPVPVLFAPAERRDVPVWLEGLGTVAAWQQVTIRAQIEGRLEKVHFKEGQAVKAGQLLVEIDRRPFVAQLRQAQGAVARDQAQLEAGKLTLSRARELRKRDLVATQQVDDQQGQVGQLEGSLRTGKAQVEMARVNLEYTRIRSPIDGVVGVRLVDPGNLVRPSDPTGIVVVTQLDPAAVFVTLPQDDLPRLLAAMKRGTVLVEAWSRDGKTLLGKGKLAVIDNQINPATATLRLKAEVPNPDSLLWPNQFVKAKVLLDTERNVVVVPAVAIQRGPQSTFVYVVGPGDVAAMRPVEVGLITSEIAVITRGLEAGEKVVVEGQGQLRPGARINPRPLPGRDGGAATTASERKGS